MGLQIYMIFFLDFPFFRHRFKKYDEYVMMFVVYVVSFYIALLLSLSRWQAYRVCINRLSKDVAYV